MAKTLRHSLLLIGAFVVALGPGDALARESAQDKPWALLPFTEATPPKVRDTAWVRNRVDAFVLARIEAAGISPAREADKATLVRRLYFDLVGLPPTWDQTRSFIEDPDPLAYERLVDRLLGSPRFGERQARHWLDVVRYAESDGYKADLYRPDAWRYRDYVIRSFNADKPYDRFLQEQLAGDELFPGDLDALVATGYLRLWPYEDNQADVARQWEAILTDVTNVTSEAILGLSYGCARCHDHKYDPITQKDYFRLRAFFAPMSVRTDLVYATPHEQSAFHESLAAWERATGEIRSQIEAIEQPAMEKKGAAEVARYPDYLKAMIARAPSQRTPLEEQYVQLADIQTRQRAAQFESLLSKEQKAAVAALRERLKAHDATKPAPLPRVMGVTDLGPVAAPTYVPGHEGVPVEPGFLSALDPSTASIAPVTGNPSTTGRRSALAHWVTSRSNPLTARVMVNRIWQQHFGVGLVATPNDLGSQGASPTHPELLDDLAARFVAGGWSLKKLHRVIVTSATYRQTSLVAPSAAAVAYDPGNTLLWRMRIRRLEAEQVRDAMLRVSGELDTRPPGASKASGEPVRSVYLKAIRNTRDPLLDAFDLPDGFNSCGRRSITTTPLQALLLTNGPFTHGRAAKLAERVQREAPGLESEMIEAAYRLALSRRPTALEREATLGFLQGSPSRDGAVADLCHILLNSNAFTYID